jgi:hypothetical protein
MSDDGREPVDPDFAALFRDEPLPPRAAVDEPSAADAPDARPDVDSADADPVDVPAERSHAASSPPPAAAVVDPESAAEPEEPAPAAAHPVASAGPVADTGRLFRSQGVTGHDATVLAVPADRAGRLRTLDRVDPSTALASEPAVESPSSDAALPVELAAAAAASTSVEPARTPAPVPGAVPAHVVPNSASSYPPDPSLEEDQTPDRRSRRPRPVGAHRGRSITAGAGYLIIFGVTFVVGLLNAMIASGDIGWPTGLALLASTVFVALTIRPDDAAVAVIAPPVAFALTAATAGQFFLGTSANGLLNRAVVWFFDLADSWPWIIGSTVVALVIVLVRRYRR